MASDTAWSLSTVARDYRYENPTNVHKKTKNTMPRPIFTAASSLFPQFDTPKKLPARKGKHRKNICHSPNVPKKKPLTSFANGSSESQITYKKADLRYNNNPTTLLPREMPVLSPISAIRSFFVCVFLLFYDLQFPQSHWTRSFVQNSFFIL